MANNVGTIYKGERRKKIRKMEHHENKDKLVMKEIVNQRRNKLTMFQCM
jgi:hypothetical protein